jgi:rabenosyn-5
MIKAKSFQPVAVLNQKLKGLDVFESNETGEGVGGDGGAVKGGGGGMNGLGATQEERDADFYVTREHWQRTGPEDYCLDPACRKPLGVVNGCVNCRKCGKLFCEEHTMYQIKLSRSALHEPVRGYWSRVCETCYKSREGYNDHNGVITDHTESFIQIRRKKMDRVYLEMTRLEKRLTKVVLLFRVSLSIFGLATDILCGRQLTQTLANPPKLDSALTGGFMKGLSMNLQNQRRSLEQTVVVWENDANVQNCPYCLQTFSLFLQPKHHCRLCGKVVCGDARTACSSEIDLEVTPSMNSLNHHLFMCI